MDHVNHVFNIAYQNAYQLALSPWPRTLTGRQSSPIGTPAPMGMPRPLMASSAAAEPAGWTLLQQETVPVSHWERANMMEGVA